MSFINMWNMKEEKHYEELLNNMIENVELTKKKRMKYESYSISVLVL